MTRACAGLVLLAGLAACARGAGPPLRPVAIGGPHPAIGRPLELALTTEAGAPAKLRGVAGRVTVVCLGADSEALAPCEAAQAFGADAIAAVGVGPVSVPGLRNFRDPDGRAAARLELAVPAVVVTDRSGRIVDVVAPPERDATLRALARLGVAPVDHRAERRFLGDGAP